MFTSDTLSDLKKDLYKMLYTRAFDESKLIIYKYDFNTGVLDTTTKDISMVVCDKLNTKNDSPDVQVCYLEVKEFLGESYPEDIPVDIDKYHNLLVSEDLTLEGWIFDEESVLQDL